MKNFYNKIGQLCISMIALLSFDKEMQSQNMPSMDWIFSMGDSYYDYGNGLTTDAEGNVYSVGKFRETIDTNPLGEPLEITSSGYDCYVLKTSPAGEAIWSYKVGSFMEDGGINMTVDEAGNVIVLGSFYSNVDFDNGPANHSLTSGIFDSNFVLKLNSDGEFVWVKQFDGISIFYNNSPITTDSNNNIYLSAYYFDEIDADPGAEELILTSNGSGDAFIIKLTEEGELDWATSIGATEFDSSNGITVDSDNNVYITGNLTGTVNFNPNGQAISISSLNGSTDFFVAKYDESGICQWAGSMGGYLSEDPFYITTDMDGNVLVTGAFEGNCDFQPGSDAYSITSNDSSNDIFLLKLSTAGDFVWVKTFGSSASDSGAGIVTDGNGSIYLVGTFKGDISFNPGNVNGDKTNTGDTDSFVLMLNAFGDFQWVYSFSGVDAEVLTNAIVYDGDNSFYLIGYFIGTVNFEMESEAVGFTSISSSSDIWLMKFSHDGSVGVENLSIAKPQLVSYPNPVSDVLNIVLPSERTNAQIHLYDNFGKLVYQNNTSNKSGIYSLDMNERAAGIYYLQMISEDGIHATKKVVKQ